MYSDKIEHVCGYCFFSEPAKGNRDHIYCTKRSEYRRIQGDVCPEYKYDIFKRPVRRRSKPMFTKKYNFDI